MVEPERGRLTIVVATLLAVIVSLGAVGTVVGLVQRNEAAVARYDDAVAEQRAAIGDLRAAGDELDEVRSEAAPTLALALDVLDVPAGALPKPEAQAFTRAATELERLLSVEADEPLAPAPGVRPDGADALVAAASDLEQQAQRLADEAAERDETAENVARAAADTAATGADLLAAMPRAAAAVEQTALSAGNGVRLNFRAVQRELADLSWDASAVAILQRYAASAQALLDSKAAEDAGKAGPLFDRRMAVEAFAHSIGGGVPIEFDWAPIVNRFGADGSYGGLVAYDEAGFAYVTLSDSVAELWDVNPAVTSLVAHEVGHAITPKCLELFRTVFGSQDETWATAWAIGMGYTGDGNGESLYGRPSDALIAASTSCR